MEKEAQNDRSTILRGLVDGIKWLNKEDWDDFIEYNTYNDVIDL